jgi:outer membrane immunogenic protein
MKKFLLGSVALAAVIAGPAMAADMPLKAPPPPPVFSWTGCYIGIEGGYGWGQSKSSYLGLFPVGGDLTPRFDVNGGLAGVEYGCNQQFGNFWVFGIEGDWSWTDKKGRSFDTGSIGIPTFQSTVHERWISTSRARVGWAWNRSLLYVTGGFAAARVEAGVVVPVGFAFPGTYTDTHILYGWTVGAGFEYAFWNNLSFKAEYLYARFDTNNFFTVSPNPIAFANNRHVDLDNNIVRVGLNWRFTECVFGFPGGCSGP